MFIIWQKQEQFNSFHVTVSNNRHFACEEQWAEFKNFFQSLLVIFTFFLISFLVLTDEINIVIWNQSVILHFDLQLFHF